MLEALPNWLLLYGPPVWAAHLLILSVWIVLQKRPPLSTLSWILSMALLPVLGFIIYFFLGPQKIRRQRLRRQRLRKQHNAGARRDADAHQALPRRKRGLGDLVERAIGTPVSSLTDLRLLVGGEPKIDALVAAIDSARHHIHMEYYILEPDGVGQRIREALVEAARRGVRVRLLIDGIGSARAGRRFLRPLRRLGVDVARFHPWRAVVLRPLLNLRTHRKIAVIDGCIGFVGGINLCNDVDPRHCETAWHDYHLRLEGQAVGWLQALFAEDWLYATRHALPEEALYPDCQRGEIIAQVLASGPDSDSEAIHRAYVQAIHDARERVWLVTPYFVPGEAALMALSNAALRGVDVRLLVPRRSDARLVDYAGRSYYDELLGRGVRIWQYEPRMLHAKALLVDSDLAMVGTANFDPRSFRLNFEVALAVYDADFTTRLGTQILADMEDARQVKQPRKLGFLRRLGEAIARLFSPLL
ncbi:cardiolipin synthase [Lysobacter sp. CAU 1642]|uniref:Cardiolipin synthase n=2 Tax=Pseudomarimonas salicorniae TaxID=2933270 RepID=A0ABT0GGA8_9GAMM|nr:cardiolipin synthase [Lysobacter sp. CAU 1642]MCK7593572.1 cardiolipin synthase [Lysobacter sp. CAU 1642]